VVGFAAVAAERAAIMGRNVAWGLAAEEFDILESNACEGYSYGQWYLALIASGREQCREFLGL